MSQQALSGEAELMAADVELLVGAENMRPESEGRVIALLASLPLPLAELRFLYTRWCALVDVPADPEIFARVRPGAGRIAR